MSGRGAAFPFAPPGEKDFLAENDASMDRMVAGMAIQPSGDVGATSSYQVYASDTLRPVEFGAADQEGLVRWVSDHLHRRIVVPDLRQAGYRYMGGRLVATSHGPAGLFMYDDSHGGRVASAVTPSLHPLAGEMRRRIDHIAD